MAIAACERALRRGHVPAVPFSGSANNLIVCCSVEMELTLPSFYSPLQVVNIVSASRRKRAANNEITVEITNPPQNDTSAESQVPFVPHFLKLYQPKGVSILQI